MKFLTDSEINGLEKSILNILKNKELVSGNDIYKTIAFRLKKDESLINEIVYEKLNEMAESGNIARYTLQTLSKYSFVNRLPKYFYTKVPQ